MKDDSVSDELTGTLRTGLLLEPCLFSRASRMTRSWLCRFFGTSWTAASVRSSGDLSQVRPGLGRAMKAVGKGLHRGSESVWWMLACPSSKNVEVTGRASVRSDLDGRVEARVAIEFSPVGHSSLCGQHWLPCWRSVMVTVSVELSWPQRPVRKRPGCLKEFGQ